MKKRVEDARFLSFIEMFSQWDKENCLRCHSSSLQLRLRLKFQTQILETKFTSWLKNLENFLCLFCCSMELKEFFYLQALPKVPVPPLEHTMTEYLRALKPIVTSQQYEKTEKIVKQFSAQSGPKLHQYLVDKREVDDNWVSSASHFTIHLIKHQKVESRF